MYDISEIAKLTKQEIVDQAAESVCPARVEQFTQLGSVPVMAFREGNYFWDKDGKKLFDVHINGGTYNMGHRNPEIISAVKEAMDFYDIGNHHFISDVRTRLATVILKTVPGNPKYCVFTASGAEAVEVALKSARHSTGRRKIISFQGSYHGHSTMTLRAGYASQAEFFLSEGSPGENVQIPYNDLEALRNEIRQGDTAAFLCEIIPATLGFPMPTDDYYREAKKLCARYGTLFVADEVQTGLGRTGEIWGCGYYGIEPDMLITGKGLSGGIYPISAAVLTKEAGKWLSEDGWGYSSTFGGAEIGCVAALKVFEILQRPGVLENVRAISIVLAEGLEKIQQRHPFLKEVRQNGLIVGLKFDNEFGGMLMTACAFECGLWAFFAGFDRSVLQFKLNLLIDRKGCEEALELLEKSIRVCEKQLGLSP